MKYSIIIEITSLQGGDNLEQKKKRTQKKEIVKETRDLKFTYGVRGEKYLTAKMTFPLSWLEHMGISPDDRETEVTYSPRTKKITIRKKSSNVSDEEVGE